jgi:thiamine biosynthesis lipoprotein
METIAVARNAMATRFEIVLNGENPVALRAAGEEALNEIERLESHLSLYRPDSDINRLNACAAAGPVRVDPMLFELLRHAQQLHRETGGTFDITVAPLMRCWGFMRDTGHLPDPDELAEARAKVGMDHVELNGDDFTVHFQRDGVMLDLGAIGKGYALECAAELLGELGITSALLHGGTSTVHALGAPAGGGAWKVAIPHPATGAAEFGVTAPFQSSSNSESDQPIAVVSLENESLSISAVWGKAFEANGRLYGHVIDPRTGEPVAGAVMAAVILPSATETDALSTGLLTLGVAGLETLARLRQSARMLVVETSTGAKRFAVESHGIPVRLWDHSGRHAAAETGLDPPDPSILPA